MTDSDDLENALQLETASSVIAGSVFIVAAYVSRSPVAQADLPAIITSVHETLSELSQSSTSEKLVPAVLVRESITPHQIKCLECGKGFKSLKKHLSATHNLSPEDYRSRWKLPESYPLVAAQFSNERSKIAVQIGLGRNR